MNQRPLMSGLSFGYQKLVEFDNGYTASIVCNDMSYGSDRGLFEIAILYNDDMVYDTGLTEDVIGFLDFQEVADTLKKIEQLPKR